MRPPAGSTGGSESAGRPRRRRSAATAGCAGLPGRARLAAATFARVAAADRGATGGDRSRTEPAAAGGLATGAATAGRAAGDGHLVRPWRLLDERRRPPEPGRAAADRAGRP